MKKIGLAAIALALIGAGCLSKSAPGSADKSADAEKKDSAAATTEQTQGDDENTVGEETATAKPFVAPDLQKLQWVPFGDGNFSVKYPQGFAVRKGSDLPSQQIFYDGLAGFGFGDNFYDPTENLEAVFAVVAQADCEEVSQYGEEAKAMTRYTGEALPLPLPKQMTIAGRPFTLRYSEDFWAGKGVQQFEYLNQKGSLCSAVRLAFLVNNPTVSADDGETPRSEALKEYSPERFVTVFTEMLKTLTIKN